MHPATRELILFPPAAAFQLILVYCGLQVKPVLSYVVLALNLMVYGNGIFIALTQGGDASNDYFLSLAKINENVVNGEYYRCVAVDEDVTIVNLTIFRAVFLPYDHLSILVLLAASQ